VVVSESADVATTWILHDTCRRSIERSLNLQERERVRELRERGTGREIVQNKEQPADAKA
jgi:hypothetical protein